MASIHHVPTRHLATVLAIYRRPVRRKAWIDSARPLPEGLSLVVDLANLPHDAPRLKQYARRLHVNSYELRAAIGFFIRQVFLAPGADHYRVLGVNAGASAERIREHYRKLISQFHPDRLHGDDDWSESYSIRINQAYAVLRNPNKRRTYDAELVRRARSDRRCRSDRPVSSPPARADGVRSVQPLSRRTTGSSLRALFASPRTVWQSLKSYTAMPRRWREMALSRRGPNGLWYRMCLILSIAAIAGCLVFVLNSLISLRLPSLVTAMRGWLPSHVTPTPATSRAAPKSNTMVASRQADPHNAPSTPAASEPTRQRLRTVIPSPRPKQTNKQTKMTDMRLSSLEADRLLARFLWAYEAGNITDFMRMFAEQAHTEYHPHWDDIRAEYAQLFANTTVRRIAFYDFRWQLLNEKAMGEGQCVVTVQHKGETKPSVIRGKLILHIRKTREGVLITELHHTHQQKP